MTAPRESYPLTWPVNWPRTPKERITGSAFGTRWSAGKGSISLGRACEELTLEMRRLGARDVIISTNLRTRLDGIPYSNQAQPLDRGVAVYFNLKDRPRVLACDRWNLIQCNLWAIVKHIESIRAQERWGVGSIDQAFAGYTALPEKAGGVSWWEILGVPINAPAEQVRAAYLAKAKQLHPDTDGGDHEKMVQLNEAYRMATSIRTQNNPTISKAA